MRTAVCPVCDSKETSTVLEIESVPVFQNKLYLDSAAARKAGTGDIELRVCPSCTFVFNAAFDAKLAVYDASYENDQTHSSEFLDHVDGMAERIRRHIAERSIEQVIEVGCGQGHFLRRLKRLLPPGVRVAGLDPAYRGAPTEEGIEFHAVDLEGFSLPADGKRTAVISRHVIEHIPRPVEFLAAVRQRLARGPADVCFLETPRLEWIVERAAFFDVFFEHCSYFSEASLARALSRAGFESTIVEPVFGAQYMVSASGTAAPGAGVRRQSGLDVSRVMTDFGGTFARRREQWTAQLRALRAGGATVLWGAGAKGVTFATTLDPQRELISFLVDINPNKQGRFLPRTAHPVLSPEQGLQQNVRNVLIMNENYAAEIMARAKAVRSDLNFIVAGTAQ